MCARAPAPVLSVFGRSINIPALMLFVYFLAAKNPSAFWCGPSRGMSAERFDVWQVWPGVRYPLRWLVQCCYRAAGHSDWRLDSMPEAQQRPAASAATPKRGRTWRGLWPRCHGSCASRSVSSSSLSVLGGMISFIPRIHSLPATILCGWRTFPGRCNDL